MGYEYNEIRKDYGSGVLEDLEGKIRFSRFILALTTGCFPSGDQDRRHQDRWICYYST